MPPSPVSSCRYTELAVPHPRALLPPDLLKVRRMTRTLHGLRLSARPLSPEPCGAQTRVLGATLGEWGREKYGLKPVKMDALEYLPQYLAHLRDEIKEEQSNARDTNAPCAFVTFRCALRLSRPNIHHLVELQATACASWNIMATAPVTASPLTRSCGQL